MNKAPQLSVTRRGNAIFMYGCIVDNQPHSHHAMQLVWSSPDEAATLNINNAEIRASVHIVEGGQAHALKLKSGLLCLLESQSVWAKSIRNRWLEQGPVSSAPSRSALPLELPYALGHLESLLDSEIGEVRMDKRIEDVLAWLDRLEMESRWDEVSLQGALAQSHLSESRFLHLFSEQVGTPWRGYLVWRRALVAATIAAAGVSLTDAAHSAGYADSAHLSRQFKALFGFTPSAAMNFSQFVQS